MRFEHEQKQWFWEIERAGGLLRVRYGKIGHEGLSRSIGITEEDADQEFQRRVGEKLRAGYRRVNPEPDEVVELIDALRADPSNQGLALVLADRWAEREDPRGELIVLESQLEGERDPHRAAAMDERVVELLRRYKRKWLSQPGGFPFQEQWEGRRYIEFDSEAENAGLVRMEAYRWIRGFVEQLTTAAGPTRIFLARLSRHLRAAKNRVRFKERSADLLPGDAALLDVLDDEGLLDSLDVRPSPWQWSPQPRPYHATINRALEAAYAVDESLHYALTYQFHFAFPDTNVPLPFQDPLCYIAEDFSPSYLNLRLDNGDYWMHLRFPFQQESEWFHTYIRRVVDHFGKVIRPRCWRLWLPAKHRRSLKKRKIRIVVRDSK